MNRPVPRTAENSTPSELWAASIRLFAWLVVLVLLVVPVLRGLPLGPTGKTILLAWLLVILSVYWLLMGHGYRPLLILQLTAFSIAVVLLTTKVGLVLLGIERLSILRRVGKALVFVGTASAALNLLAMLVALGRRFRISVTPSA
jgi:hypothetical protein